MNVAEKLDVVKRPQSWDKALSVAYLRLLGWSQEAAAKAAGIGVRTLRRYELSDWWPRACGEAVGRWMQQLEIEARTTVIAAVREGDVVTAMKVLERIDKRLAPPRQQYEPAGYGGGPIENRRVVVYLPENGRNPNDRFGNGQSPSGDQAPQRRCRRGV